MWLGLGDVGREVETPSDRNGVGGSLIEKSLGGLAAGGPLSPGASFS